jgi:Flp pilus assembly protein TadD
LGVSSPNGGDREAASDSGHKLCSYYRREYRTRILLRGTIPFDPKARRVFQKIPLNYHHAHFHNFVSLYLARKGKIDEAIGELRKAARLRPDDALFHHNLGTIYYYKGAYSGATEEFKKALKIDPLFGMGYANLSYVCGAMGREAEALDM